MIEIIDNPHPTRGYIIVCPDCQCKFTATEGDFYPQRGLFGIGEFILPDTVRCPNCGKELTIKEKWEKLNKSKQT